MHPRLHSLLVIAIALSAPLIVPAALSQPPQPPPAPAAQPVTTPPQRWKGIIEIRGLKLDFGVTLSPGTSGHPAAGTLDIPLQGLKAVSLSDVSVSAEELKFTLALPGTPPGSQAVFALKIAPDGKSAKGELRQSGVTAPVSAELVPEGTEMTFGPARPQEPKPPFPYTARDVTYTNAKDGTTLAGTITLPPGPGPHPAVVMITGSGAQDRDESLLGHKPFLVIADHLSRHGIAVLRADDRGVGGSTGNVSDATAQDSVGDVLAAVALLKTLPEIDHARIGVIGHSEGGIIGPMAAAASHDVAFVVMLAGTGVKGRDILTMQSEAIMRAAGLKEDLVAKVTVQHKHLMDMIEQNAPPAEIEAATLALVKVQVEANASVSGGARPSDAELDQAVKQQMAALDSKWFRSFLFYDPRDALRHVTVPVLALNGSLDVQVPPKANLPEIEKALKEAGNTDITVREMPGLNHLFQTARTGGPSEYAEITETFSPAALDIITQWILAHSAPTK